MKAVSLRWTPRFAPLSGWLDRWIAARYCARLRVLYARQRALDAALRGEALYAEVVRADLGVPAERAREIVESAADSYAAWPTARAVTFRDVAHYLIAVRLASRQGWVEGEIRGAVNSRVPSQW